MKAPAYLLLMCSLSLAGAAQNFNLSFKATGAASSIDSVTAIKLATQERIIVPGNKTLVLSVISGIPHELNPQINTLIFPNPTSGKSTVSFHLSQAQPVRLSVTDLIG